MKLSAYGENSSEVIILKTTKNLVAVSTLIPTSALQKCPVALVKLMPYSAISPASESEIYRTKPLGA